MAYTTIDNPELYFQTKLYTGNSSTQSITFDGSENMQPDWVWSKARSQSDNSAVIDSVRGGQKQLRSNTKDAELTRTDAISSFDSNGFSMGSQAELNSNSVTYVAWNWKAGGSASNNTDGSTTSSVSNNSTAKFSIGTYTGTSSAATIGHGLGAAPGIIIVKNRSSGTRDWAVYHRNLSGTNKYLKFNESVVEQTDSATWNNTTPTSSVFASAGSGEVNQGSENFVFYAFTDVKGYSKFSKYVGNGDSSDGTFVYTGFRPSFILYKNTMTADSWFVHDNKRQGFNDENEIMFGDITQGEATVNRIRILSNGFKAIDSDKGVNKSGDIYVYMAFAESPFVNSSGVPTNAR
tara:strand:- start:99 stop:1145 length:1047 start_codon:yes stop_codon:yes gene_type:complete